jgi:hypothetical protein
MSYHVALKDPLVISQLYTFSFTSTYICDFQQKRTTEKGLNVYVYGADVTHYREENSSHVSFECRTGLLGAGNSGITMNVSFTANNSRRCSAICGKEQQPPCDWNNVAWIESDGLCRVTIEKPVESDSGTFCCGVSSQSNSYLVTKCDDLSVENDRVVTPPKEQPTHATNKLPTIVGATVGSFVLIAGIMAVVVVLVVWQSRRGRGYVPMENNGRGDIQGVRGQDGGGNIQGVRGQDGGGNIQGVYGQDGGPPSPMNSILSV